MKNLIVILLFLTFAELSAQQVIKKGDSYYLAGKIVIKFKSEIAPDVGGKFSLSKTALTVFDKYGVSNIKSKYPDAKESGLSRIAVTDFSAPYDIFAVISSISKLPEVEWVEPYYVYQELAPPNDPDYYLQYYLPKIDAENAWTVNTGSPDVIIAIVDTGVDWDHPDLAENIWTNDDPINGIDDDNNGYIDDIRGWDFGGSDGTPDNDPMEDQPDHGTLVAGLAAAVTNNGIGIASIGYNSTLMPVKVTRNDRRFDNGSPMVIFGYEGIKYAADNGADIINCSWGGFSYSSYGQEIVSYAVDKGCTVVAAAGNNGADNIIYPSAFDGVLSVGATNQTDNIWYASNYGILLDMTAPGQNIHSTWMNDTYFTASGTSAASPIVAGIAALVKAQFPSYNPLQIAEQIRATTDNIDANNSGKEFLLGSGRANAYRALTETNAKSVRISNFVLQDNGNGNGVPEPGENFSIIVEFTNYLTNLNNLQVQITANSSAVTINSGSFNPGAVETLGTAATSENDFTFTIADDAAPNSDVDFFFTFSDGTYSDFQWKRITVNPSFATQSGNDIALTLTSRGLLGFDELDAPTKGIGFKYQDGPNLLYIGNFMYGTSSDKVASAASLGTTNTYNFTTVTPFTLSMPGGNADVEGFTSFDDSNAGAGRHNILTKQYSYSFSDIGFDKFIILNYHLVNNSGSSISGFHAGIYLDWDINSDDYNNNTAGYDETDNFGYAYNTDLDPVSTYVGGALLSEGGINYYALMNDASDGGIGIYDGFTDAEKWQTMSGGIQKKDAGNGDVSFTIAGGPYTIPAGEALNVAFAIAAGDSLDDLRTSIQNARIKYAEIPTGVENQTTNFPLQFSLSQNYPNPFNPTTVINYSVPSIDAQSEIGRRVSLKVFDVLGREVAALVNTTQPPGNYKVVFNAGTLASGVYLYTMRAGEYVQTKKMLLLR